jgi:hypothetical protein
MVPTTRTHATVAGSIILVVALGAAVLLVTTGSGPGGRDDGPVDPGRLIIEYAADLRADGPYRSPTSAERGRAESAADSLADDGRRPEGGDALDELGFSAAHGTDPATGREYAMFVSEPDTERAWGIVLVDLTVPANLVLEIPHPNSDLRTERVGVELFRRLPGAILLVAGAHRRAAGGAADVAHNRETVFHAMASTFARRSLPQLQLHGYADHNLPGAEVVVSAGSGNRIEAALRLADEFAEAGFATCRAWRDDCAALEGRSNVQGQDAQSRNTPFVHLEISHRVRTAEPRRQALVEAVVAADIPA